MWVQTVMQLLTDCCRRLGDNAWIHLDDEDSPRVWLQLDRGHTSFAGMEICEYTLGLHRNSTRFGQPTSVELLHVPRGNEEALVTQPD